ncbi:MAG: DNA repair protein RecO [Muribaculaceae bacterium]|nr:DNA repair protein RecO [Muribaculaceae bacterium]
MTEKFIGIVIDVTRHSDRYNVVTLYTRSRGRVSFISSAAGGKAGKIRQARLQPLSVIEGDYNFRPNSELQKLGAFSLHDVWADIYFNPIKQMIAMFLSEFLNRLLKASMPDTNLWDYIHSSLHLFDIMKDRISDFHIVFLSSLLPFAGIQPDPDEYSDGYILDMQTGSFSSKVPLHHDFLKGDEAAFAAKLCRVDFSNMRALRLNRNLRYRILDNLLKYYGIHFPGASNLKSIQVIHDIFN